MRVTLFLLAIFQLASAAPIVWHADNSALVKGPESLANQNFALTISPGGLHHVLYRNLSETPLCYRAGDQPWLTVVNVAPNITIRNHAIALSPNQTPHLIYAVLDTTAGPSFSLRRRTVRPDGTLTPEETLIEQFRTTVQLNARFLPNGTLVVLSKTSSPALLPNLFFFKPDGTSSTLSLPLPPGKTAFSEGYLHIEDSSRLGIVAALSSTTDDIRTDGLFHQFINLDAEDPRLGWELVFENAVTSTDQRAMQDISLVWDQNGQPTVTFFDRVELALKASVRSVAGWDRKTIQQVNNVGNTFTFINEKNQPAVAWGNLSNAQSYYSEYSGSNWSVPTSILEQFSVNGYAADPQGHLHLHGIARSVDDPLSSQSLRPLDITDLDHDGVPYLLEIATLKDPLNPASKPDLTFRQSASGHPFFALNIPDDSSEISEAIYFSSSQSIILEIQASNNLRDWTSASELFEGESFTITGRPRILTMTLTGSTADDTAYRYMRVKATRNR